MARLTKAVPGLVVVDVVLVVQEERVRIWARRCFRRPPALSRRWGLLSMKGVCIAVSGECALRLQLGAVRSVWVDVSCLPRRVFCLFGVPHWLTLAHTD